MSKHTFFDEGPSQPAKRPANGQPSPRQEKRLRRSESTEPETTGPAIKVLSAASAQKKQKADEKKQALLAMRQHLPVWSGKTGILDALKANDTLVILGETGSGKTTRGLLTSMANCVSCRLLEIPQFVMDSAIPCPDPKICVTQPRRVAATTLASRVSEEVGCKLGNAVGYSVRFDDKSKSDKTRLKFVTDGTLLQEIRSDPTLERYDVVFVDEAHERSLQTDIVLGHLKNIQTRRKELVASQAKKNDGETAVTPLKIIVMSATLDAELFADFFDKAKILYVKGRQHKVSIWYCPEQVEDYKDVVLTTCFQIHVKQPPGDILVFLTGEEDIVNLQLSLLTTARHMPSIYDQLQIVPLYAKLSPQQQQLAFQKTPPRTRKIVLATNVAETSITIPGIKYVIDPGLMKEKRYNASNSFDSLLVAPISRSSAQQRAGRAGREAPGSCYRLYTESQYHKLEPSQEPEIQRSHLGQVMLQLLASGVEDPKNFPFLQRPPDGAMVKALMELFALGAINEHQKLTPIGQQMAELPLEPQSARMLLKSFELGCPAEIISLVSLMVYSDSILITSSSQREEVAEIHAKFAHRDGDHFVLLNVLRAFEALPTTDKKARLEWCKENYINARAMRNVLDARQQLKERCTRLHLDWQATCKDETEPILECLLAGFYHNTAVLHSDGFYRRIGDPQKTKIKIYPGSVLHLKKNTAIIFKEIIFTSAPYLRCVSTFPAAWIDEKRPAFYKRF